LRISLAPPFSTARLREPEVYQAALRLLRERHGERGSLAQAGVELDELPASSDPALSRLLARKVASGEYAFSPVTEREAYLGGKVRRVYRAPLADTVVLFVLAGVLTELVMPAVCERVYSYRKGRSSRNAVVDLAGFVRRHRAAHADPRSRGVHVLRRDIVGYGDRIPVDDASPLWPLLTRVLEARGCPASTPFHALLRRALRPLVLRQDGTLEPLERGVPMGSPLQPSICNLYLDALDRTLEALPGGFYARFGDDMLFAHESSEEARAASEHVARLLGELHLELNASKSRDLYWNGAGRPSAEPTSPLERGTTHIEYLGQRLAFDGGVALSQKKLRRIRSELGARIVQSELLLREIPLAERAHALSGAVASALDPTSHAALALAPELAKACDDRRLLAQLDHWLTRTLSEALSGRRGARAFRSAPPRFWRAHGLISLVARRDRARTKPPRSEDEP
jgi:hypothetical protein